MQLLFSPVVLCTNIAGAAPCGKYRHLFPQRRAFVRRPSLQGGTFFQKEALNDNLFTKSIRACKK
jgi:hypothetical protein